MTDSSASSKREPKSGIEDPRRHNILWVVGRGFKCGTCGRFGLTRDSQDLSGPCHGTIYEQLESALSEVSTLTARIETLEHELASTKAALHSRAGGIH